MGFTFNDLQTRARSYAVAAATDIPGGPCRVFSISVSAGADAATVSVFNNTAASGADVITVGAALTGTGFVSFEPAGIRFDTSMSISTTGTTPTICVTYMAE